MSMVTLRNVNPLGYVDVPVLRREGDVDDTPGVGCLVPGEEFEVDAAVAGRAPSGSVEAGDYDPGEGLLAQVGNYELVTKPTPKK